MTVHVLKCEPEPFDAVADGSKPFEWRSESDRSFSVGDLLILMEWQPNETLLAGYTGEVCKRRVTYVLRGAFGVPPGFVVMGLRVP
jgi:hypothetical protein